MTDQKAIDFLGAEPLLMFSWEELEEELTFLAASDTQRSMVGSLISATRKQAAFLPKAQVLREILCLGWVIADEDFRPGLGEELHAQS